MKPKNNLAAILFIIINLGCNKINNSFEAIENKTNVDSSKIITKNQTVNIDSNLFQRNYSSDSFKIEMKLDSLNCEKYIEKGLFYPDGYYFPFNHDDNNIINIQNIYISLFDIKDSKFIKSKNPTVYVKLYEPKKDTSFTIKAKNLTFLNDSIISDFGSNLIFKGKFTGICGPYFDNAKQMEDIVLKGFFFDSVTWTNYDLMWTLGD